MIKMNNVKLKIKSNIISSNYIGENYSNNLHI